MALWIAYFFLAVVAGVHGRNIVQNQGEGKSQHQSYEETTQLPQQQLQQETTLLPQQQLQQETTLLPKQQLQQQPQQQPQQQTALQPQHPSREQLQRQYMEVIKSHHGGFHDSINLLPFMG